MKEGWKRVSLEEIATDMYRGSGIKRDQVTSDGCPCVRYGEIYTSYNISFDKCISHTDENIITSKKYFENGDILFAITGESVEDIGKSIAYLGAEKCLCGGDIVVMKHNQDPKCLAYALATQDAIKQKGFGKTKLKVVHTNVPSLKSIKVNLPETLSEQQRIVSRLDASFTKIDALSKQAEEALEQGKALFQAKLKELMEKKEGWEEKKIEEVSENLDYRRKPITKGKRESGVYPYYGASGIVDYVKDYIYDEDILLVSEDGANLLARSTPIAFSVTGKVWVNNHAHVLKFDNFYTQRFVEYFFASIDISPYVTGAAQPKFNQARLNSLVVPMPPLSEQEQIVQTLDSLSEKIKQLQQNYNQTLANCQALKQALLRETFE